jgi:hypothetical protein
MRGFGSSRKWNSFWGNFQNQNKLKKIKRKEYNFMSFRKRTYSSRDEREDLKEKAMDLIEDDLQAVAESSYPHHTYEETHHKPAQPRNELTLGAANAIIYSFAAICFILPLIMPEYQIAYGFGIALLLSTLTQSDIAKLASVIFTVVYFLLFLLAGYYFDLGQIWGFLWSVNTISLVPVLVGTIMAIIVMGTGVIHGLAGNTKYAGLWLVGLALIISIADALVAAFILAYSDWAMIFLVHLAIYIAALLIAWGLFYVPARLARYGIDATTGGEE